MKYKRKPVTRDTVDAIKTDEFYLVQFADGSTEQIAHDTFEAQFEPMGRKPARAKAKVAKPVFKAAKAAKAVKPAPATKKTLKVEAPKRRGRPPKVKVEAAPVKTGKKRGPKPGFKRKAKVVVINPPAAASQAESAEQAAA